MINHSDTADQKDNAVKRCILSMSGFAAAASICFILIAVGSPVTQSLFMLCGAMLIGVWLGGQKHAEEIYLNNSVDKDLIVKTDKFNQIGELAAYSFGAIYSLIILATTGDMFATTVGLGHELLRLRVPIIELAVPDEI